jgi:hypothetical protein
MVLYDNNRILEPNFTENGVELTVDNANPAEVLLYKIAIPHAPVPQAML